MYTHIHMFIHIIKTIHMHIHTYMYILHPDERMDIQAYIQTYSSLAQDSAEQYFKIVATPC